MPRGCLHGRPEDPRRRNKFLLGLQPWCRNFGPCAQEEKELKMAGVNNKNAITTSTITIISSWQRQTKFPWLTTERLTILFVLNESPWVRRCTQRVIKPTGSFLPDLSNVEIYWSQKSLEAGIQTKLNARLAIGQSGWLNWSQ